MNYLAHTLLSQNHIDYQLGNILADPLKGKAWQGCSTLHVAGLEMHKSIDQFTDSNIHVARAKDYLGTSYLRGVVVDIVFDYYLTKHWTRFVRMDKDDYIQSFYRQADKQCGQLPEAGRQFIKRIIRYDFFHLYRDLLSLQYVFQRFDNRLSEKLLMRESTSQYVPLIERYDKDIEKEFLLFFPELVNFFLQTSALSGEKHFFVEAVAD